MCLINSNHLIPIIQNFKLHAGPGAGKTYFLTNHIKNVILNHNFLPTSKVGCITYTNLAVEELRKRLENYIEKVEISTIHSFLYNNIFKPFIFLINEPFLNKKEVSGHSDTIVNKEVFYNWKKETKQAHIKDDKKVYECLTSLQWKLKNQNELYVDTDKPHKKIINEKLSIKNNSLIEYKKLLWKKGVIEHDDVLYFSYNLLKENPRIVEFIKNKLPFLFIDEFQDTNPIQTEIIKFLSNGGITIGIIGDICQSIYSFQGSKIQDFGTFSIQNIKNYSIVENNRSSKTIIEFLNKFRNDFQQQSVRDITGDKVKLFIGSHEEINNSINISNLKTLVRKNKIINILKKSSNVKNLFDLSRELDSNFDRQRALMYLCKGFKEFQYKKFKDCIASFKKITSKVFHEKDLEKNIIKFITFIDANKDLHSKSVTEFILEGNKFILSICGNKLCSDVIKGDYKTQFTDLYTFENLLSNTNIYSTKLPEKIMTIHSSKGLEFDNVLVFLEDEKKLKELFCLDKKIEEAEESRIYYVALSRAREKLFIGIDNLSSELEKDLINKFNLEVTRI